MRILPTPEIHAGESSLNEINNILSKLNAEKVMIITDAGIVKAGIYAKLEDLLNKTNKKIVSFTDVQPDPSIDLISSILEMSRKNKVDAVIGIGGGSSLDTAKVVAALANNDKSIDSYIGIDLLEKNSLPIIAIPTTAGTGSEVTPIAILSDEKEQLKKGIVSNKIIPQYAILDPELTVGLPPHVTAATGMDALIHALEAYTSVNANSYSDTLALKAIQLISSNIREAYNNGKNLEIRTNMLLGSLLAGMAFANAGVTAVHAFAYPLGGMFHIPHGLANSLMLTTIMEFNMVGNEKRFTDIGKFLTGDNNATAQTAINELNSLCNDLNIPQNLAAVNIPENAIHQLAEGAIKVTRLLANNPRKITLEDAIKIYSKAYARDTLVKAN